MSKSESNPTETEYEFEPFEFVFLSRRDEILKLVGLTDYALRSTHGLERLTSVLKKPNDAVEQAREIEASAQAEVDAGLPLLHGAAAVLIWGALEAAFRDFLVRWFVSHPSCLTAPEFRNVRVRVGEYEGLDGEDRMRFLVDVFERELSASLKPGAGRYTCMLKPLGIVPDISDKIRRDLNELAATRNVIVHRAGIADERFVDLCPWLGLKLGDTVAVDHSAFERFIGATSNYVIAIIESARSIAQNNHLGTE